jgi:hypothetical protein
LDAIIKTKTNFVPTAVPLLPVSLGSLARELPYEVPLLSTKHQYDGGALRQEKRLAARLPMCLGPRVDFHAGLLLDDDDDERRHPPKAHPEDTSPSPL